MNFPELTPLTKNYKKRTLSNTIILSIPIIFLTTIIIFSIILYNWVETNTTQKDLVKNTAAFIPIVIASFAGLGTILTWVLTYQEKRKEELKESLSFEQSYTLDKTSTNFPLLKIRIKSKPNTTFNIITYIKIVTTHNNTDTTHHVYGGYTPQLNGTKKIIIKPKDIFIDILNLTYGDWINLKEISVGYVFNDNTGKTFHIKPGENTPEQIKPKTTLSYFNLKLSDLTTGNTNYTTNST